MSFVVMHLSKNAFIFSSCVPMKKISEMEEKSFTSSLNIDALKRGGGRRSNASPLTLTLPIAYFVLADMISEREFVLSADFRF